MNTEWPDMPRPETAVITEHEGVIANWVPLPEIPSKSPMKYAVDYRLVDEDGQLMEDTDYFIAKDDAWDRAKELYELSELQGTITFREL